MGRIPPPVCKQDDPHNQPSLTAKTVMTCMMLLLLQALACLKKGGVGRGAAPPSDANKLMRAPSHGEHGDDRMLPVSRKHRDVFLVKNGCFAHTTTPTSLTYTTPLATQHLHHFYTARRQHNIRTVDIHHATVYTYTTGPIHRSHTPRQSTSLHSTYAARRHHDVYTHR